MYSIFGWKNQRCYHIIRGNVEICCHINGTNVQIYYHIKGMNVGFSFFYNIPHRGR